MQRNADTERERQSWSKREKDADLCLEMQDLDWDIYNRKGKTEDII